MVSKTCGCSRLGAAEKCEKDGSGTEETVQEFLITWFVKSCLVFCSPFHAQIWKFVIGKGKGNVGEVNREACLAGDREWCLKKNRSVKPSLAWQRKRFFSTSRKKPTYILGNMYMVLSRIVMSAKINYYPNPRDVLSKWKPNPNPNLTLAHFLETSSQNENQTLTLTLPLSTF